MLTSKIRGAIGHKIIIIFLTTHQSPACRDDDEHHCGDVDDTVVVGVSETNVEFAVGCLARLTISCRVSQFSAGSTAKKYTK